jgi:4-carboxymuconolactone decarboxylase
MARLPEVTRDQVAQNQQHIYDEIAGSRGSVRGPFAILMHSPEMAGRAANLGAYLRFETSLDKNVVELVTLAVARELDCQYEWTAHEPQAREAQVREEAIAAIKERRAPQGLSDDEAVLVGYAQELVRDHKVSDATFAAARERLGDQGLVDLTATIGYYSLIAAVLNAFDVQPASGVTPLLPL